MLDPVQKRVFVVGADGLVAEVGLDTLAVSYHAFGRASPPPISADVCESRSRMVRWLGGGLIAVSGFDRRQFTGTDGRRHERYDPAGLSLVDVWGWSAQLLDQDATSFRVAGRQLLATGIRWDSSVSSTIVGMGVASYALDGAPRFQLFEGRQAWVVEAFRGRAYVAFDRDKVAVVDLVSGAVIGERSAPVPLLLVDDRVSLFSRR